MWYALLTQQGDINSLILTALEVPACLLSLTAFCCQQRSCIQARNERAESAGETVSKLLHTCLGSVSLDWLATHV